MSDTCEHSNPLRHEGTSQQGRALAALDPANIELHGLNEEEWLAFARDYARLVNYYAEDNPDNPKGTWQDFFPSKQEIASLLERYGQGDVEPHRALFLAFLKLLDFPQQSLNKLPKRHLDFYYQEVLKIEKQPFTPDQVHVIFELAKNARQKLVEEGVLLKAGKDSNGNPLQFETVTPLVANKAGVKSLKSVFVDESGVLRHAPVVNSDDGQGGKLEEDRSWSAFGSSDWPTAPLGFFISSSLLQLKEGQRTIQVMFKLSEVPDISAANIQALFTGEKEWIQADAVKIQETSSYNFILNITVGDTLDAISGYNEEAHSAGLDTAMPAIEIRFSEPGDYQELLAAEITGAQLKVQVEGIASLSLQNELGNVDPSKPFMPFGASPSVGSRLSIIYEELWGKPVTNLTLDMSWLNLPVNFSEHYRHYFSEINTWKDWVIQNVDSRTNSNAYFTAKFNGNTDATIAEAIRREKVDSSLVSLVETDPSAELPDTLKDNYKFDFILPDGSSAGKKQLFQQREVSVDTGGLFERGSLKMVLLESFYHDLYPELYVNAVKQEKDVDLPNEPYTPLLDELKLGYTAAENLTFSEEASDIDTLMYHRHPFGVKRVQPESKSLVPRYISGELYIGLQDIVAGQNISLLFEVEEGSENPLHADLAPDDISWSVLSDNSWLPLDDHFARNETNNFLRSGIVEIGIPTEVKTGSSLMDPALHWLRVQLPKEPDSVAQFIAVHAQAAKAQFINQNNTTDHLIDGLPAGTIGKMANPRAQIKSVVQPYPSFGGSPAESDTDYYRRVSERLRHKNRAVSIWDYEHLVLQQFPSLYKVKCLNHAYWNGTELDELAPGNVTLVLVPKIGGAAPEFRLKPMVSQNVKEEVEAFVENQCSLQASVNAVNPAYEAVQFAFDVRFRKGLDFSFYKGRIKEDLKRLLAPWVFDTSAAVRFGGSFTEYQVVNFLENLDYVDYIENFRMYHEPYGGALQKVTEAKPSMPLSILVPHPKHVINEVNTSCE